MTIIGWIIIGLVAAVMLANIAHALFDKILVTFASIKEKPFALIQHTILGVLAPKNNSTPVLFVPDELLPDTSPLPSSDPEFAALLRWKAPEPKQFIPKKVKYASGLINVHPQRTTALSKMYVEDIYQLQILSPGIQALFSGYPVPLTYPVVPPLMPPEIPDPPLSFTPWERNIPEPKLNLPIYSVRFDFLNKWARKHYSKEITRYEAALNKRQELVKAIKQRDKLAQDALNNAKQHHARLTKLREKLHTESLSAYEADRNEYLKAAEAENNQVEKWRHQCGRPGESGLLARLDLCLRMAHWPRAIPRGWETRFDADSGILILEYQFPDVGTIEWVKRVELKNGLTDKPANKTEQKQACAKLYPALCLRLAAETMHIDSEQIIKAVAINGWAMYREKATGQDKRAYCASLFATREQIAALRMDALEPEAAFRTLKGLANTQSLELVPIAPVMRLNMEDPRFVDPKEVLDKLRASENLAAMGWEDFEHLVRELFERAFASTGAQVKVTQASRDHGVDAVIFDPDPLRGGKLVVQAKRYTNTVDVAAVRDLYGAVISEGAVKGILVTTSHYGPEAYSFAKDKNLTLINGEELLGLLAQHGYKFRIDLIEARALAKEISLHKE